MWENICWMDPLQQISACYLDILISDLSVFYVVFINIKLKKIFKCDMKFQML